jgi:protein involved in polysaccharide export with SLBB domain
MIARRLALAAAAVTALLFLSGCETPTQLPMAREGTPAQAPVTAEVAPVEQQALDASLLKPSDSAFKLGPGDKLDIEVMGDAGTRSTVTVGPDGRIYYNILPGLDVWGLTLPEARGRLEDEMRKYVREKPVIAVSLREVASQQVWVLGRLNSPGVYPLGRPTTLLDAVAEAGGLGATTPIGGAPSETADLSKSFIIRNGHIIPVDFEKLLRDGDMSQNVYLQPGDFIFLPSLRSSQIHILGAVLQPRSERMRGYMTLVQAIALAGGTVPGACLPNVAILRGSLANPQIAVVDVKSVLRGKSPDVRLEAGDIVYVPYRPETLLVRYLSLAVDTFVRTVGVNEGAYAVSGKNEPITVGVNISP